MIRNLYQWLRTVSGLSFQLAAAEFKLRNEGSYLGIFWYLLNPILTFGVLLVIFGNMLGDSIPHYPVYLMLGVIMFNMFQASTTESARAILRDHTHLIKSIKFPTEALVLSIVLKNVFSHIFEIILFTCTLLYFNISLIGILFYIPVLLLFILLITGSCLFISALTVHFADLDNIWNFTVRIIWFATPIFYSAATLSESSGLAAYANLINPLFYIITAARDLTIYQVLPPSNIILGCICSSIGIFALGWFVFGRLKSTFAERI